MRVNRRLVRLPAIVAVIFIILSQLVYAQVDTGTVSGMVTNPAGEGALNAGVTLKDQASAFERSARTRGNGSYHFASVKPGTYTVTVELKGFAPAIRTGLVVDIQRDVVADFSLQPERAEAAEGTAPAAPVKTRAAPQ